MNSKSIFFETLWDSLNSQLDILVLRNYEEFPNNLGNDIDFLVMKESFPIILYICNEISVNSDYKISMLLRHNHCLISIYFENKTDSSDLLKVDFFSQLSKGWMSYANTEYILNNKTKYKKYNVPMLTHEAYLLLMKELLMYGRVRSRYIERFSLKYQNIDFNEIHKLSKGLVKRNSILKIEKYYHHMENFIFRPLPTIKNIFQPFLALEWLYHSIIYRLKIKDNNG
jgi:hypothetical protein